MTKWQRTAYVLFSLAWLAVTAYFWNWWVGTRGLAGNPEMYVLVSLAWFYSATFLPSAYLFFLGWMRYPRHIDVRVAERAGVVGRVAVITLTVPGSESIEIVRRQLAAMRAIRYPHDSWILVDKVHSPEIKALAREMGVFYFCRADSESWGPGKLARWNAAWPPFQAKTKAGNVNSWLDQYGRRYTHFTQFDIDHRPVSSYLHRVLGYFTDRKIAWVQAPSVYGNHRFWTARGSSEQEVVLQGPLQMGFFGFCRTPFIIGSHCTYDMRAILAIGGFQPTRAEDHLDTVCLAAAGREGVYLPEVIATGDGPETFDTYLAQQFAWAFSMIQVLLRYTPRLIRRYKFRQACQFLFAQTWYTFWSLSMVCLFVTPLVALALDVPVSHAGLWSFLAHSVPTAVVATVVWWWSRRWHQPRGMSLSWRGVILHMARWTVVLSAFVQVLMRVKKPYMITVKGMGSDLRRPFPIRILVPYLALIMVSLAACWAYILIYKYSAAQGYLFFGLEDAALFYVVVLAILWQDAREMAEERIGVLSYVRLRALPLLLFVSITSVISITVAGSYERIVEAVGHIRW